MKHLGEQITDFVFGDLSAAEMADARRHVAECAECRKQIEQLESTRALLRTSVDLDPPRHLVFEFEKPRTTAWRWLVPIGAAAAVIIAVLIASPIRIQWGTPSVPSPVTVVKEVVQPVDYDRIIKEVQTGDQAWLLTQLQRRDAEQTKEIQRLRGQLAFLDNMQRSMFKETLENSTSIQILAQGKGADSQD